MKHLSKWLSTISFLFIAVIGKTQIDTLSYQMKSDSSMHAAFDSLASSPKAEIQFYFPVFNQNSVEGAWMNENIKQLLEIDSSLPFEEGLQKKKTAYFDDYINTVNENKDDLMGPSWNFQSDMEVTVPFQDNGFITINTLVYDFSGGAHGNYAILATNYDVLKKRKMQLRDILTADSTTLQKLIEAEFRKDNQLKPDEALTGILFDDALPPNNNFYFTKHGLGFRYNPYEVASYATGVINVLIPFKNLDRYLIKSFRERMKIK